MDEVTEDNVYVLKGLAEDIAAGPDQVDRLQLELAVELLSDVGKYVENTIVEERHYRSGRTATTGPLSTPSGICCRDGRLDSEPRSQRFPDRWWQPGSRRRAEMSQTSVCR